MPDSIPMIQRCAARQRACGGTDWLLRSDTYVLIAHAEELLVDSGNGMTQYAIKLKEDVYPRG